MPVPSQWGPSFKNAKRFAKDSILLQHYGGSNNQVEMPSEWCDPERAWGGLCEPVRTSQEAARRQGSVQRAYVALSSVCPRGRLGRSLYVIQVKAKLQSPCCTSSRRSMQLLSMCTPSLALCCCQHLKVELSSACFSPCLPEPRLCSGIMFHLTFLVLLAPACPA